MIALNANISGDETDKTVAVVVTMNGVINVILALLGN